MDREGIILGELLANHSLPEIGQSLVFSEQWNDRMKSECYVHRHYMIGWREKKTSDRKLLLEWSIKFTNAGLAESHIIGSCALVSDKELELKPFQVRWQAFLRE